MDFSTNFFDEEEENIYQRFSTIVFGIFALYLTAYYGILRYYLKCPNMPSWTTVIAIIVFHIAQIVILRRFHNENKMLWCLIIGFAPIVLYLMFSKYYEHMKTEEAKKINLMMYQLQQQNQPNQMLLQQIAQQSPQQQMFTPPPQMMEPSHQQPMYTPNIDNLMQMQPQNLNQQQMQNIANSQQIPGYNDYMTQFNSHLTPF